MEMNITDQLNDYCRAHETLVMDETVANLKRRLDMVRRHLRKTPWPGGPEPRLLLTINGDSKWFTICGPLAIGAGAGNGLQLDQRHVSRMHCRLKQAKDLWLLTDLDSTNGVYVNGNRISSVVLKDGDIIQIGTVTLIFFGGNQA